MESKLTAVEWLVEQIEKHHINQDIKNTVVYDQAKQMEKEQCMVDYKHGQNNGYMYRDGNGELIQAEQYYNETYTEGNTL